METLAHALTQEKQQAINRHNIISINQLIQFVDTSCIVWTCFALL